MDPMQLEALHGQLRHLRAVRERLAATDRIAPGHSTFWRGLARDVYETGVLQLDRELAAVEESLELAIAHTQRALAGAAGG